LIYKALTIAGSDSGGGAGIQADLKTFQELDVYGMSAITAVTAQNTFGVHGVQPISVEFVSKQIDAVAEDIGVDAVKTGMLFSSEIIQSVAAKMNEHKWEKVVVDPVMISKGGSPLLQNEAILSMQKELLPVTYLVTPNLPETEVLTGITIHNEKDKMTAAKKLMDMGVRYVLIKGGHDEDQKESIDLLYDGDDFHLFKSPRYETKNTHGTGCTFSAAITAELAKGDSVYNAVQTAKRFISAAIKDDLGIGGGHGPTNHWAYKRSYVK